MISITEVKRTLMHAIRNRAFPLSEIGSVEITSLSGDTFSYSRQDLDDVSSLLKITKGRSQPRYFEVRIKEIA